MKYSSSTLKVPLNQCSLQAYIEIAALRVLAISVKELGSGVLRNHYIIKVLYVFVFFFCCCGRCRAECRDLLRNVEGRQGMKNTRQILLRESTLKPKDMLLLFINECQSSFWNQVFIEAIVTSPGKNTLQT